MIRVIDLNVRPYPAPDGDIDAVIKPVYGWRPVPPIQQEIVAATRNLADILSFSEVRLTMNGVQPGEIFNHGWVTTKPYCSYATYCNPTNPDVYGPRTLADIGGQQLVGKPAIIELRGEVKPGDEITVELLEKYSPPIPRNSIVLIRTGYSNKHRSERPELDYYTNSPVLTKDAAEWLVKKEVKVVGSDVRTLDPRFIGRKNAPNISQILNQAGVVLVEDLVNLDQINEKRNFVIIGIPLPIRGVTGGPIRAFAVNRENLSDVVDISHPLNQYPEEDPTSEYPFVPPETKRNSTKEMGDYPNPLPGRIEPREVGLKVARTTKISPFRLVAEDGEVIGDEMYINYGHSTTTHIEGPFFDPWGRHNIPDEIMRRYVRMPIDKLIGEAVLIDLSRQIGPRMQIEAMHLERANPGVKPGDIVLVSVGLTDWYFYGASDVAITPGFSPDAAHWLVDKGISVLAMDFPSCERSEPLGSIRNTGNKIHYHLHRNDVPVIDWGMNFGKIKKERFLAAIMALPTNHQGGFPAHFMAIEDWD